MYTKIKIIVDTQVKQVYILTMQTDDTDIIESHSDEQAEAIDAEMQYALLKQPTPVEMDFDPFV